LPSQYRDVDLRRLLLFLGDSDSLTSFVAQFDWKIQGNALVRRIAGRREADGGIRQLPGRGDPGYRKGSLLPRCS
jgi:hypothetical protein